ncbi:hypothetical protein GCM10018781_02980 [Kitasatospora indigofera]|uniref:Uncharacterized protein n=2 Tax=Kitasatospora indigofera TaxID=67307 RepID=A0A919KJN3_9ACTN|nr:hypothetical protein GCM10018781_02980 [Kitasatospora indigofera]
MDRSAPARRLDGRSAEVVVRNSCRGPELGQQIWAAALCGYHLERHDPGVMPSLAGPRLHFVLDPDPAAQQRAAWMSRPAPPDRLVQHLDIPAGPVVVTVQQGPSLRLAGDDQVLTVSAKASLPMTPERQGGPHHQLAAGLPVDREREPFVVPVAPVRRGTCRPVIHVRG